MKIYLDYIFFENVIINYIILTQVSIFTKSKPKRWRQILAVVVLSLYTTLTYVFMDTMLSSIVVKILSVTIAIYFIYLPKTLKEFIKKQTYYYVISFLYVGVIISLTLLFHIPIEKMYVKISVYLVGAILLYLFNKYMWKMWKSNIKSNDLTYTIVIGGQEIRAFVDTGHTVKDPISHVDVLFLEEEWFTHLSRKGVLKEKVCIPFHTMSGSDTLDGYMVKNVTVYKGENYISTIDKIVLVFVKEHMGEDKKYSALIGYNTYVEKLKGVTLC